MLEISLTTVRFAWVIAAIVAAVHLVERVPVHSEHLTSNGLDRPERSLTSKVPKNINVFRTKGDDTFAVSTIVLDKLFKTPGVKPSAVTLYIFLLRCADQPIVRLHNPTVAYETSLSRETVATARQWLVDQSLITATDEHTSKGFWTYELLSETGGKLPTPEDWIVFKDLTDRQIEQYYANRLGLKQAPSGDGIGKLKFPCPFHVEVSSKHRLSVTIKRGSDAHGMFVCGAKHCAKRGGLITFEQHIGKKHGRELSKQDASSSLRGFFTSTMDGSDTRHPALRELMDAIPAGHEAI